MRVRKRFLIFFEFTYSLFSSAFGIKSLFQYTSEWTDKKSISPFDNLCTGKDFQQSGKKQL
ncbi:MAG: hypothetical protein ACI8ZT_002653 [Bacteroidia bacterium]|jgi:hypothetical protein